MFDVADLPLRWPVEVNYHEAKAYCAWRGPHFRLLAEAEYHALRSPAVNSLSLFCCCALASVAAAGPNHRAVIIIRHDQGRSQDFISTEAKR